MDKTKTTSTDTSKIEPIKSVKTDKPSQSTTNKDKEIATAIIVANKDGNVELSMTDVEKICSRIAAGMLVRKACQQEGISEGSFWGMVTRHEEARQLHIHARVSQAWMALEKIAQVEDDLDNRRTDPPTAKVLLDSLRWRLGKMIPLQFGEQKADTPPQVPITITAILAFDPSGQAGSAVTITPISNENKQIDKNVR
jgi:hypothetical protein